MRKNRINALHSSREEAKAGAWTTKVSTKNTVSVSVDCCMRELGMTAEDVQFLLYHGSRTAYYMDDPAAKDFAKMGIALSWMIDHGCTAEEALEAGEGIVELIETSEV